MSPSPPPSPRARTRRAMPAAAAVLALVAAAATAASAHGAPAAGHSVTKVLYVSPAGRDRAACTRTAPCRTIHRAVAVARSGATVVVRAGTYAEQVTIAKRLSLVGLGRPTIDASGRQNGVVLDGPRASGAVVRGFVVEHAEQEGILARRTSHVTITGNVVQGNDLGASRPHATGECAPEGNSPGDCGEGLHLMSVTYAKVDGNRVTGNSGGIKLTDELGPSAHNQISRNRVVDNPFDCGITIAGHNDRAVQNGVRKPKVAGIYANTISGNVSVGNGLRGEGAGILLAGAGAGTGVYDNLVEHNTANGNNLAGVTLHSHSATDDLNGNRIVDNHLSDDTLGGDWDARLNDTAGIVIFSAFKQLKGVVVRGNVVSDVHFGIWTQHAPAIPTNANRFANVDVPLHQQ